MVEQKIKRFVYDYNKNCSIDITKEITEELTKGWNIKFQPTVIPAFGRYATEIIFILERKVEERNKKVNDGEKQTHYSWWLQFDTNDNVSKGYRCINCAYENYYKDDNIPNECPNCHAKMDNECI